MFCVRAGATATFCFSIFAVTGVHADDGASALTSRANSRATPAYAFGVQILSTAQSNPLVLQVSMIDITATSEPQDSQWGEARAAIDTYLATCRAQSRPEYTTRATPPTTEGLMLASLQRLR
jgi:hypothetical protein